MGEVFGLFAGSWNPTARVPVLIPRSTKHQVRDISNSEGRRLLVLLGACRVVPGERKKPVLCARLFAF